MEAGGEALAKQPREIVLRVETSDVDDGMRVVEQLLVVAAKKWRHQRTIPKGGKTVVLEYQARLRRTYTPDRVRGRLLQLGAPFVRLAEWRE
jgi:hypothetical protein